MEDDNSPVLEIEDGSLVIYNNKLYGYVKSINTVIDNHSALLHLSVLPLLTFNYGLYKSSLRAEVFASRLKIAGMQIASVFWITLITAYDKPIIKFAQTKYYAESGHDEKYGDPEMKRHINYTHISESTMLATLILISTPLIRRIL